ncbi:MAG: class I SAM-dependent methyltransferase [Aureliella sp.]
MDFVGYNSRAWDQLVAKGNVWTIPVSQEQIAAARASGVPNIVLTPQKSVPESWLAGLRGANVLCLAGGGGQQGPLLAACGANVTVFDNSPWQLDQDRQVAQREGLAIELVQGDMRDLSELSSEQFDLIVHPCSNTFVDDVRRVWQEAFRVLKSGGALIAGFCNPLVFIFDYERLEAGELVVRYSIPFSDIDDLPPGELEQFLAAGEAVCFGHTLEDQIGGQTDAGFSITGFYEDNWDNDSAYKHLSAHIACFAATRAIKS